MRHIKPILVIGSFLATLACGGGTFPFRNSKLPLMRGTWNMVLMGPSPSQGAPAPPSATLTMALTQDGSNLVGTVLSLNNPSSSCFSGAIDSETTFTMSGHVIPPGEALANLELQIKFSSGSLTGMITANGFAEDSTANGSFDIAPNSGCTGGTFTMQKIS